MLWKAEIYCRLADKLVFANKQQKNASPLAKKHEFANGLAFVRA